MSIMSFRCTALERCSRTREVRIPTKLLRSYMGTRFVFEVTLRSLLVIGPRRLGVMS